MPRLVFCRGPIALAALLWLATAPALLAENALTAALESIRTTELRAHVDTLADDTFEGREAGTRGGHAAAGYIVRQLQRYGVQGGGEDGGYFQPFGAGYRNILAVIPGSDPQLRRQTIVIGAHYDHVGYGTPQNSYGPTGYIHNGADDNASGVAGLLEVIEAFTLLPSAPRRTLLFAFWDGEEKGLLGSKHWTSQPTLELGSVVAKLNIDMIGRLRNNRAIIYGVRTGAGLRHLVSEQNDQVGLDLDFDWELKENSDHWTFFSSRVPVLMLHTGLHDDYHRPRDDSHKINAEGITQVSRLMFHLAYSLANDSQRRAFRPEARRETPAVKRQLDQPLPPTPARLGVAWKNPADIENGLEIATVGAGSAAAAAGLRVGDKIVAFNGHALLSAAWLHQQVLMAEREIELSILREGEGQPRTLRAELHGRPVRLGVSWRVDDAEPETVTVARVISGSAGDVAGVRVGDRICAVDGEPLGEASRFAEKVRAAAEETALLIERNGRRQQVLLKLPTPVSRVPASAETSSADDDA